MRIEQDDFDYFGIEELTNDGRVMTADAVLFDSLGHPIRVRVGYRFGADAAYGAQGEQVDMRPLMWLLTHGHEELLEDVTELMALQRDWLKDKDTMGATVAFVVKGAVS